MRRSAAERGKASSMRRLLYEGQHCSRAILRGLVAHVLREQKYLVKHFCGRIAIADEVEALDYLERRRNPPGIEVQRSREVVQRVAVVAGLPQARGQRLGVARLGRLE